MQLGLALSNLKVNERNNESAIFRTLARSDVSVKIVRSTMKVPQRNTFIVTLILYSKTYYALVTRKSPKKSLYRSGSGENLMWICSRQILAL